MLLLNGAKDSILVVFFSLSQAGVFLLLSFSLWVCIFASFLLEGNHAEVKGAAPPLHKLLSLS